MRDITGNRKQELDIRGLGVVLRWDDIHMYRKDTEETKVIDHVVTNGTVAMVRWLIGSSKQHVLGVVYIKMDHSMWRSSLAKPNQMCEM